MASFLHGVNILLNTYHCCFIEAAKCGEIRFYSAVPPYILVLPNDYRNNSTGHPKNSAPIPDNHSENLEKQMITLDAYLLNRPLTMGASSRNETLEDKFCNPVNLNNNGESI